MNTFTIIVRRFLIVVLTLIAWSTVCRALNDMCSNSMRGTKR